MKEYVERNSLVVKKFVSGDHVHLAFMDWDALQDFLRTFPGVKPDFDQGENCYRFGGFIFRLTVEYPEIVRKMLHLYLMYLKEEVEEEDLEDIEEHMDEYLDDSDDESSSDSGSDESDTE